MQRLSEAESSTLNLRTLQPNCSTSSQPDFQGRFHLQITTSCKALTLSMSWCEQCAFLQILFSCWNSQALHTPGWAGFWTSVRVSLFQEAIQAQVLHHPGCYWCCSCRNWFPACQIQPLYAKNLTLNGISEFLFFFQEPLQSWEKQQVF